MSYFPGDEYSIPSKNDRSYPMWLFLHCKLPAYAGLAVAITAPFVTDWWISLAGGCISALGFYAIYREKQK